MIVKSIVQKLKNKFNISVAEIDEQDVHQTIVIGTVGICGGGAAKADSIMENIINFVECNTDAEIINIESEEEDI